MVEKLYNKDRLVTMEIVNGKKGLQAENFTAAS